MPIRRPSEDGATFVEYALLLAYIAILCIAAAAFVGGWAHEEFKSMVDLLP